MMLQPNALKFRRCNILDANMLHEIYQLSYKKHYTDLWYDQGKNYLEKFHKLEAFEKGLLNPDNYFYLIYTGNEPIGFFKLTRNALDGYEEALCMEINKIYILS